MHSVWAVLTGPLIKRHFQARWRPALGIDIFADVGPRRDRLEFAREPSHGTVDGPEAPQMELRKRFDRMANASPKPVSVVHAASL